MYYLTGGSRSTGATHAVDRLIIGNQKWCDGSESGHHFSWINMAKTTYSELVTAKQIRRMIDGTGCANCGREKTMIHCGYDCCGAKSCLKSLAMIAASHVYANKLGGPPRVINCTPCKPKQLSILDKDISVLKLSARSQKAITQLGLQVIGDLIKQSDDSLLACKGFGPKCLKEIKDKLAYYKLSLK